MAKITCCSLPVTSLAMKCAKYGKSIEVKKVSGKGEQNTPYPREYEKQVLPKQL